jgi:hypothetical protein
MTTVQNGKAPTTPITQESFGSRLKAGQERNSKLLETAPEDNAAKKFFYGATDAIQSDLSSFSNPVQPFITGFAGGLGRVFGQ